MDYVSRELSIAGKTEKRHDCLNSTKKHPGYCSATLNIGDNAGDEKMYANGRCFERMPDG